MQENLNPPHATPPDASREMLRQHIQAYRLSQCVYVAAELGLADLLRNGPRHISDLAAACGAQPQTLNRLMHTLVSLGIFHWQEGELFELNEAARFLCQDHPDSLRPLARLSGQQFYPTWGHLLHSVRTGETAFDNLHGMNVWQFRSQNQAAGELFTTAMSGIDQASAAAVVETYDFSRFTLLVDIGGGKGAQLAAVLQAYPGMNGILFDQEHVLDLAEQVLQEAGVLERCRLVAGNFLETIPLQGDAFLLKRVLHDWDDNGAACILTACRAAMQPGQTLLVVERLVPADHASREAYLTDLTMMVMNGGRERSQAQFQSLLGAAGFELLRLLPTRTVFYLLEARAR